MPKNPACPDRDLRDVAEENGETDRGDGVDRGERRGLHQIRVPRARRGRKRRRSRRRSEGGARRRACGRPSVARRFPSAEENPAAARGSIAIKSAYTTGSATPYPKRPSSNFSTTPTSSPPSAHPTGESRPPMMPPTKPLIAIPMPAAPPTSVIGPTIVPPNDRERDRDRDADRARADRRRCQTSCAHRRIVGRPRGSLCRRSSFRRRVRAPRARATRSASTHTCWGGDLDTQGRAMRTSASPPLKYGNVNGRLAPTRARDRRGESERFRS